MEKTEVMLLHLENAKKLILKEAKVELLELERYNSAWANADYNIICCSNILYRLELES